MRRFTHRFWLVPARTPCDRYGMDWLMAHFGRLAKLLRDRGRTREEAEDLIQEAFLRVKVYCDEGGEVREPEAFLVRTVLNLSRDVHEHEHRHLYAHNPVEEYLIVDPGLGPDEVLALEQRLEQLRRALGMVSERTRECFYLHRLDGLSYAQIADHFDISVSAVEKHIAKAMSVVGREMLRP